jgi:hypothetical protein
MSLVDTTDGQALRKAQVEASLKLARTAVVGGIVNAIIVATVLWSSVSHAAIAFWTLLVLGQGLVRILHARRLAKNDYEDLSPSKDGRFIELLASLNGVAWGFSMAIGGFDATPGVFTLLAMLTGGMMGAAVISYGPLPRAAFAYMIPLTIGSIAGWLLSGNPLAMTGTLLILCYAAVLSRSIKGTEKVFAEKVAREQALRESAETVQLLLKDYEAQSADWLWSIDREDDPSPDGSLRRSQRA